MPSLSRPFTFDRVFRILAGLALLVVAIMLINYLKNVLLPFCLACLVAYMLQPVVEFNTKFLKLKSHGLAVFLTLLETTAIIVAFGFFFIPSIIDEIDHLSNLLNHSNDTNVAVPLVLKELIDNIREWVKSINISELIDSSHFESIINSGTSILSSTIDFLLHTLEWLLAFIYVIFILIDYKPLMKSFRMLVPRKFRPIVYRVGDDIKESMNRYFRSQAVIALCASVLYSIGFSIVGIPLAIVLGIVVGILYMIPYFQYVTLIPVILVCLIDSMTGSVQFWPEFGQCILVYVVSQSICDYVLTPKIMGKSMGLNPAIILLSLSVWGTLLGIIGMIIALPMTALLLAYYQEFIIKNSDESEFSTLEVQSVLKEITEAPTPPLKK